MITILYITIVLLTQTVLFSTASDCENNTIRTPSNNNIRVWAVPDNYFIAADPVKGTQHSGFLVEFLDALTTQANLTYNLVSRPDLSFGNQQANGSWDGSLIGALLKDEADLIGATVTINTDRETVVDFMLPFSSYNLQLIINIRGHRYIGATGVQYLSKDNAGLSFLKKGRTKELRAIYNSIKSGMPDSIVISDDVGLAKVIRGNYGYISKSPFPDQAIARYPKKIIKMQNNLATLHLALAMQQGSPLRKRLNFAYLQLVENGIFQSIVNKYNVEQWHVEPLMGKRNRGFKSTPLSSAKKRKESPNIHFNPRSARLSSLTWNPVKPSPNNNSLCPVYLMHGLLGYKEEFAPFGQIIADRTGHQVTAFDARNHGESEHVDYMDYIITGDDMANYMELHNVKEAIYIAHSMGAGSAIALALRRPELVKALMTIDVGMSEAPRKPQLKQFLLSLQKVVFNQTRSLSENRESIGKLLLKMEIDPFIIDHRILPNIIERDGQILWRLNLPILTRDIINLTQAPVNILLDKAVYTKPVFILIGNSSDYVKLDEEVLIFNKLPNAKLQRVDNAGHWIHFDQSTEFLEAAVKFIRGLDK